VSKTEKEYSKVKNQCFRFLKIRPRSEYELRVYLKRKKANQEVIDKAIAYLSEIGLIDDCVFAKAWAESRVKQSKAKTLVSFELLKKGVDKKVINSALDQAYGSINEDEVVRNLVEQKMRSFSKLDKNTAKRRIWSFLVRRGFSKDAIMDALNEI